MLIDIEKAFDTLSWKFGFKTRDFFFLIWTIYKKTG